MNRPSLACFALSLLAAACSGSTTAGTDAQSGADSQTVDAVDVAVVQGDTIDVAAPRDLLSPEDVADVPSLPDVVDAPSLPDVVDAPSLPDVVDAPSLPDVVDAPSLRDVPSSSDAVDVPATMDAPDAPQGPDVVDAGPPGCDGGATLCDGACVNLQSTREHCGACGQSCCAGLVCNRGSCDPFDCAPGMSPCAPSSMTGPTCRVDRVCVNLAQDARNCGACGRACAPGSLCLSGECVGRAPGGAFIPPARSGAGGALQVVATGLGGVQGLLLSPSADMAYVSATGVGVIWRVPLGSLPATPERWAEGLVGPSQMTFDPEGRIVVAEREGNRVTRITINPDGSAGARTPLGVTFQGPWGVLCDASGNVLVSNEFGNTVDRVTPMGAVTRGVVPMFPAPLDLRWDASGNLYVGDYGSPLTSGTRVIAHDGALSPTRTITGLLGPIGVALDLGGDVYVANYRGNNVVRVSPTGASTEYATGLSGPHAIAFDAQGRLYVADYGNQRLVRFARR